MRRLWVYAFGLLLTAGAVLATGCGNTASGGSGTLSITTATLPSGTLGAAYSASLTAGGGVAPYTFSGTAPAGLTLSSAGVLSGTPTTVGTSSFTATVSDSGGSKASAMLSLTVNASLAITTTALAAGSVGTAYSATVVATGGSTPYVFAISSGTLPAGLSISSGGVLSGTPTTAGTSTFTVVAADAAGARASQNFSLTITAAAAVITLSPASLPAGTVGGSYAATLTAGGGTAPYSFSTTSGTLPAGVTLTGAGALTGTLTTPGTYSFTITATDANGAKGSQAYTVAIAAAGSSLLITTTSLPAGTMGTAYSQTILATGGATPYSYAVTGGALPGGLGLAASGAITGTPTTAGSFSFTVTVTDAASKTAVQSYSVTVSASASTLALNAATLPAGSVGKAYSASISATGGTAPYSFAVMSGSVPLGTSLSPSGLLSGTPTTANTYSFTVTVTDNAGATASRIYSVEIDASGSASLLLTTSVLPNAVVNTAYSYALSVSNGVAPYTYKLLSGSLPNTITLSSGGLLSGTATTAGAYNFTVGFTDSAGNSNSAALTLTVVTTNATVVVDTTTTLATLPANFYGLHTSVYDTNMTDTSTIATLLQNTGVTALRYPGGGYSDNYHWAQHSMTPFYATNTGACGVLSDGYAITSANFGTFAKLLQASGAAGVITINYGNSLADASATVKYGKDGNDTCSEPNTVGQPQEAAAWVAYANGDPSNTQVIGKDAVGFDWKTVGFWAGLRVASPLSTDDGYNFLRIAHPASLGVRYWEIGNEMYYNGWATNHNAESDNHAPYVYPNGYGNGTFNSRASLAALSPTAYGTNAVAFIQAMKAVDPTVKIGVDFSSPISTDPIPTTWNPDLAQAVCAGTTLDFAIMHYYPGTYTAVQPGELLSLPQADIPNVVAGIRGNLAQYCPANASNIQVLLTETSPNNGLAPNFPQPVIGLFTLNDFLTALNTGITNIDWLELHDGSFLTESEVPGPSYYGILMAHQLLAVGDASVKTTSSTSTIVSYASLKQNGQKGVVLINANASSTLNVQVTINGATLGSTATEYSYGVNAAQSGTSMTSTSFPITGSSFSVSVPAFTAVELIIP